MAATMSCATILTLVSLVDRGSDKSLTTSRHALEASTKLVSAAIPGRLSDTYGDYGRGVRNDSMAGPAGVFALRRWLPSSAATIVVLILFLPAKDGVSRQLEFVLFRMVWAPGPGTEY